MRDRDGHGKVDTGCGRRRWGMPACYLRRLLNDDLDARQPGRAPAESYLAPGAPGDPCERCGDRALETPQAPESGACRWWS